MGLGRIHSTGSSRWKPTFIYGETPFGNCGLTCPAVQHGEPVDVSCRIHAADGTLRSVLIAAETMEAEPSELSMATSLDVDVLSGDRAHGWPVF